MKNHPKCYHSSVYDFTCLKRGRRAENTRSSAIKLLPLFGNSTEMIEDRWKTNNGRQELRVHEYAIIRAHP
jgi:hypothetical protein